MAVVEVGKKAPKFRRDRAAREKSLIDAARIEFSEKGYDAATTKGIARRAGCSEALITNYFGSKEGLLLAIMKQRLERDEQGISLPGPERDDLADEIGEYVAARALSMTQDAPFQKILWSRMLFEPSFSAFHVSTRDRRIELIAERLRRHARVGQVRPDVDLESAALLIGAICNYLGLICGVAYRLDEDYIRKYASAWARVIARGLVDDGESASPDGRSLTHPH